MTTQISEVCAADTPCVDIIPYLNWDLEMFVLCLFLARNQAPVPQMADTAQIGLFETTFKSPCRHFNFIVYNLQGWSVLT